MTYVDISVVCFPVLRGLTALEDVCWVKLPVSGCQSHFAPLHWPPTTSHCPLGLGRHMHVHPVDPLGARPVDRHDVAGLHSLVDDVNAWHLGNYTVALEF